MAVSARPANDVIDPATVEQVDMRGDAPVRAGTYAYDGPDTVTAWHAHDLHQIEYALHGFVEVETAAARYLLPPQQAMWIPAGRVHRTTLKGVRSVSVFFDPVMFPRAPAEARVLAAAPVVREMILYGARWPIARPRSDPTADAYFEALAALVADWLDHEAPLCVPNSDDPYVAAAAAYVNEHLDVRSMATVCEAIGVSERTLRRRCVAATGLTWRRFLVEHRMLRAMALLSSGHRTVLDVALAVGFESASAFSRAFRQQFGESPTGYRRRVLASAP
jgi:AraC-like DNA-binding protein